MPNSIVTTILCIFKQFQFQHSSRAISLGLETGNAIQIVLGGIIDLSSGQLTVHILKHVTLLSSPQFFAFSNA
jgi:hypothetical protein